MLMSDSQNHKQGTYKSMVPNNKKTVFPLQIYLSPQPAKVINSKGKCLPALVHPSRSLHPALVHPPHSLHPALVHPPRSLHFRIYEYTAFTFHWKHNVHATSTKRIGSRNLQWRYILTKGTN